MDWLLMEPCVRDSFARLGLASCAAVVRHFTGGVAVRPGVRVGPARLAGPAGQPEEVFYKQYEYARPAWGFLGRASKARREWDSYAAFARLEINCAERLAVGEERDALGRLQRAFILTRTVPEARTLTEFVEQKCADRRSAEARMLRGSLLRQLADMTRRLHKGGFFHNDLYWRNILVTRSGKSEPVLWWIDCPRGHFSRWKRHRLALKDLAALDRLAAKHCSWGERLRFVREYLGRTRLDDATKELARAALAFRLRRWREDAG